jgi:hypothetical protein
MRTFIQYILFLLVILIPVLIVTSCENEDDIEAIFNGKTWKITGATIQGKTLNGEKLQQLYTSEDTYAITFNAGTFSAVFASGSSVQGTWKANGKKQTFVVDVTKQSGVNATELSSQLFTIFRTATKYSGDANVLKISSDSFNYLRLTAK